MPDVIQLLPDSIANQIAAGEVIQRPSSVVKELMENSIDAGADEINVIIKDAGKTLIQVIDNGSGMSETDARMSFERHATSKIRKANDLFSIRTKGFRGEALASIAAIAQVEMITKTKDNDLGSKLVLEGSDVKKQEFCQAADGTKISVKNLFYNVPARRKFLKTDSVELKHLSDEFIRIALAHENVKFTLHHNDREMYHLSKGKIIQRIAGIFGKRISDKLVPLSEETDIVQISGYVGKPEISRRSRNQQFLFVNKRFIKSHYLHHAIKLSFEDLIPSDEYPVFFVFLEINPERIDINIHPTKQEIKFEEERLIYNYLRVSVKQALGKYNVTPMLDFDKDQSFDNVVDKSRYSSAGFSSYSPDRPTEGNRDAWEKIYEGLEQSGSALEKDEKIIQQSSLDFARSLENEGFGGDESGINPASGPGLFQLHASYIFCQIKDAFIIVDQKNAHERILYEKYLKALNESAPVSQTELFPQTIELKPERSALLLELLPSLVKLGFVIEEFGKNSFIIKSLPSGMSAETNIKELVDLMIEAYSSNIEFRLGINENLARSFAVSSSMKAKKHLTQEEMQSLVDNLFACENPYNTPGGRKCFITYDLETLKKNFK